MAAGDRDRPDRRLLLLPRGRAADGGEPGITGRIVNIASIAGKEGNPNASAYSAAKAGVIGLTKSLGKELAETGIRVNAVAPAAAKTEIFAQMTPAQIDYMLSKIPMGRFVWSRRSRRWSPGCFRRMLVRHRRGVRHLAAGGRPIRPHGANDGHGQWH